MTPAESIQLVASIATVALVCVAAIEIRIVRKQARTSFEDDLTTQYRRIMEHIPIDICLGSGLETIDKEQQSRCRDAIFRYIDLSNEQAFLYNKNRVTNETWVEWRAGIKTNMNLPAFKQVWAEVRNRCPESFKELQTLLGG